jgi:hypothetical protein
MNAAKRRLPPLGLFLAYSISAFPANPFEPAPNGRIVAAG